MDAALSLPPLLIALPPLPAEADALAAALQDCRAGRAEVGAVYHAGSPARLDLALVLGPEVAPRRCWEMLFLAAVAFGDAVGAIAPPELAVHYRWPDALMINGARVGRVRLAMAPELDEAGAPLWLAVGLAVAVQPEPDRQEPGLYLDRTTLFDEGAVEQSVADWAEAFARHLLVWIHRWEDEGFRPIHEAWWARHDPKARHFAWEEAGAVQSGSPFGLDEHGGLLVRREDEALLIEPERLLGPQGETGDPGG